MTRNDWILLGGTVLVMEALLVPGHGFSAAWLPLVVGVFIGRDLHHIHQREMRGHGRGGLRVIEGQSIKLGRLPSGSASPLRHLRSLRPSE
jgi:hypothetical protein